MFCSSGGSCHGVANRKKKCTSKRPEIDLFLKHIENNKKKTSMKDEKKIDTQLERMKKVLARENMQRNSMEA